MMLRKFLSLSWVAVLALVMTGAASAPAEDNTAITFLSESELSKYQSTIKRLEKYLTGISTIVSDFTQIAPDSSLTSGKFYMQRPGKMRWQYNPPTPILMVADGSQLVFYDYELEQVSYIPLDSNLVGFLAGETIRFDDKVSIISVEQEASAIRIALAQREKPSEGQLLLEFSDKPLLLRNMVVTDATGQVTTISLNRATFDTKLDPELFVFKDPRKGRRKI